MAASSPELDAASRARVIAHMNADHAADVSLILQFYAGQSPPEAAQARMTDIDMVNMTIESASGTHVVRIIPTMAKWADCRASLVSMSRSAHAALDPVPFAPPEGWDIVVTAGVVLYFVCYALVQAGLGGCSVSFPFLSPPSTALHFLTARRTRLLLVQS